MQYLVALQDQKSFSKAADFCSVTQPTLSAGIKEMENILGQPVIDRSTRKVVLTALGRTLAEDARDIIERAQGMMDRATSAASPMTGTLRLGVIPTIAPYLLPDILPDIQKTYPALDLQLYEDLTDRLLSMLRKGALDAALIAFPYDTPDLVQRVLFEEAFYLALPDSRIDEFGNLTPDDLDPGELLLLEDGHCLSDHALLACDIKPGRRRRAYSATSLPTLLQMVSNKYGVTLLPEMAARSAIVPDNVHVQSFKKPEPTRKIGLVWRVASPRLDDFERLGSCIKSLKKS